jgi:hypothetical protein
MAIVADKYTLAPACCMVCRLSKTPCFDMQSENDDLAYQVSHNYLCRDCVRDLATTITRWGIEHQQRLGWSVITDEDREHLENERNAAIQEAEALGRELREFDVLKASLGRLRLTPDEVVMTPLNEAPVVEKATKAKQRVGSGPINP